MNETDAPAAAIAGEKKLSHPSGWMRMGGDDVIPTVSQHQ